MINDFRKSYADIKQNTSVKIYTRWAQCTLRISLLSSPTLASMISGQRTTASVCSALPLLCTAQSAKASPAAFAPLFICTWQHGKTHSDCSDDHLAHDGSLVPASILQRLPPSQSTTDHSTGECQTAFDRSQELSSFRILTA